MAPRYELVAVGEGDLDGAIFDLRIVRDATAHDAFYAFFLATAHGPYASREGAESFLAQTFSALSWRADLTPRADERPCPACGAPSWVGPRYPRAICAVCVLEATDGEGRALRFENTSMSGGFQARREDGAIVSAHECWVRGLPCWADEAHMGGIVVEVEPGFGRRGGSRRREDRAPLASASPYRLADERVAHSRFPPRVLVRATTTFGALLVWLALVVPLGFVVALASAFAGEHMGWTLSRWAALMAVAAAVLAVYASWRRRREPALLVAVVDERARTLTVTPIGAARLDDVRGGARSIGAGDRLSMAWVRDDEGGDGAMELVLHHGDGRTRDVLWRLHPLQANVQIAAIARFVTEVNGDLDALDPPRGAQPDPTEP